MMAEASRRRAVAAVAAVLVACGAAAVAGAWLGSVPVPPDGTVRLLAGVPEQVRELWPVGTMTTGNPPAVFLAGGVVGYVTADRSTLQLVDADTGAQAGSVGLPGPGGELVAAQDGRTAYVGDAAGVLHVVDADARAVTGSVPVGGRADAIAVSPDGGRVYVGDAGAGSVAVVDPAALRVVARWPAGHPVSDLAVGADGTRLVAAGGDDDVVTVLDTTSGKAVATAPVPRGPFYAPAGPSAVAAGRTAAYVAGGDGVTVVDLATGSVSRPRWTTGPVLAAALSPDGRRLYLVTYVSAIDDPRTASSFTTVDTDAQRVLGRTAVFDIQGTPALVAAPDGRRLLLATEDPVSERGPKVLDLR